MKRLFFLLVSAFWLFSAAPAVAQIEDDQDAKLFQKVQHLCDLMRSINNTTLFTLDLIQQAVGRHDYYWQSAEKIKLSVYESDALITQAKNLLDEAKEINVTDATKALDKINQLVDIAEKVKIKIDSAQQKLAELINALIKQPGPSPKIKI
jgi:hypothetical protein